MGSLRAPKVSWRCLALLCLLLNLCLLFWMYFLLDRTCPQLKESVTVIVPKTLPLTTTVVILDFELFAHDLEETVTSVCKTNPKVNIVIVSQKGIYPPLKQLPGLKCPFQVIATSVHPLKLFNATRPEFYIKSDFVLVIPDSARISDIRRLDNLANSGGDVIVVPFSGEPFACHRLNVDFKRWTLNYSSISFDEGRGWQECNSFDDQVSVLLKTSTLFSLNEPFLRPFSASLSIQAKLRNLTLTVDTKETHLKMIRGKTLLASDAHIKWKYDTLRTERIKIMHQKLGFKRIVDVNGNSAWSGCTKESRRCFGTVFDDMPDYLFEGRWTPPCCLNNLRTTARYVFQVLETYKARYWLEGGSLLGAVRGGDIIHWDYDVDIGIWKDDLDKVPLFEYCRKGPIKDEEGFVWEKAREGDFFRVQFSETNRLHVDIFPFHSKNGTMTKDTWFENHPQDMEFPEHYLHPLSRVKFVGWEAYAPNNPVEFLELKFGKGVVDNPKYPAPHLLSFSGFD